MGEITRRQFLGAAAGLSLAGLAAHGRAEALSINPRSSWAAGYPPKGPLENEDVRFLLVHHSASRNGHTSADVPGILRSWFNFHTGPEKGWNDIAYNFIVDSEGGIWEGRSGSIDGAIRGDATGGNQGFSQLVCVIGDFNAGSPTPAALDSLARVLAWLADKHGISTTPGSTASFTSLGSNRWPAGAAVTTPTIAGHRDMSKTTCPGDNLYSYVVGGLMADVQAVRTGGAPQPTTTVAPTTTTPPPTTTTVPLTTTTTTIPATTTTTTIPTTTTTIPPTTTTTLVPSTTSTVPPTSTSTVPGSVVAASPSPSSTVAVAATAASQTGSGALVVGGAALAAVAGAVLWRWRRLS